MEDSERRKAIELLKEMRARGTEEGKTNNHDRLNWMYKGPSDLIDKEEYLLGKAIDKTFEVLDSAVSSDVIGRTGEQSNIPQRLLEKTDSTEQVDIAKKILEDPLYAIKQKEMEARKKLLNNPVKLKQIKQMLLERNKQNSAHKQKKKKSKKNSEEKLNRLIIKKLKKFTDKEKRKALNKVLQSDSDSDSSSTDSSSSSGRENKKKKSRRKRTYSSSSESDSSSSMNEKTKKNINKKRKGETYKKKHNKKLRELSSDSDSSSSEKRKEAKLKKLKSKKRSKKVSSSSSSESSSDSENTKKSKKNFKSKRERKNSRDRSKRKSSMDRDEEKRKATKKDISFDKDRRPKKNYGSTVLEGAKPSMKSQPVPKYEKTTKTKANYVSPGKAKPLSEKEREEKLRTMMEDAKLRKRDRENNLANHRKKQAKEEVPKDYDEDFIRRQMKHLTSQGTMADRIKSNVNNIQRSKSSMDSSFMRK